MNQANTVVGGSAQLSISDNNGTLVYFGSFGNGTFGTTKGVHGSWTIRVILHNYSGTLNVRVQKA